MKKFGMTQMMWRDLLGLSDGVPFIVKEIILDLRQKLYNFGNDLEAGGVSEINRQRER